MRKYTAVLIAFIFSTHLIANAGEGNDDWIKKIIDYSINTRFQEAEADILMRIDSGYSSYQTYFYYASILNSKMTHNENFDDEATFLSSINRVINITDSLIAKREDSGLSQSADLFFYRGSAYGYLAYFLGQKGDWYKALNNGMQSVDDLERAIECDSTMWDAYLGLGVYKYWKSTKLKFVLWLPFVSDRREEGIENIKTAIVNDCHSRYLAMHQLIYILIDHKEYDSAIKYGRMAIEAYPQSQFMWWAYAHCYYKKHDNDQAIQAYRILLNIIESDTQANPMHWMTLHIRFAELYQRMGKTDKVDYHCRLIMENDYPQPMPESGLENLEKAKNILRENENKI